MNEILELFREMQKMDWSKSMKPIRPAYDDFFVSYIVYSLGLNAVAASTLHVRKISAGQTQENPVYCAVKQRMDMTAPTVCR